MNYIVDQKTVKDGRSLPNICRVVKVNVSGIIHCQGKPCRQIYFVKVKVNRKWSASLPEASLDGRSTLRIFAGNVNIVPNASQKMHKHLS